MNIVYETDRLILKILNADDAGRILEFLYNNKDVFETYEPEKPAAYYTIEHQISVIRTEINAMLSLKFARFYVFTKEDPDKIIGSISLGNVLPFPYLQGSIGYKFDKNSHGHGYAAESLTELVKIAFNELKLHRLEAYILQDNLPSVNLIERIGFSLEGVARQKANINGHWEDNLLYSLINY